MAGEAMAATHTWVGPVGGNWSVAGNWSGGVPTTGEAGGTLVVFNAGATSLCNIDVTVDQVRFAGTGCFLLGDNVHVLRISGLVQSTHILNDTGTSTIASTLPVQIVGNTNLHFQCTAGSLLMNCAIANAPGSIAGVRYVGPGSFTIGSSGSTYTGTTGVNSGTVILQSTGATAFPGDVNVGTGSGPGALLRLGVSNEIPNTASLNISADGTFDLNSLSETIGALIINRGVVTLGTGGVLSLTEDGFLSMSGGSISGGAGSQFNLRGNVTAFASSISPAFITVDAITLNTGAGDVQRTFTIPSTAVQPACVIEGELRENSSGDASVIKEGAGILRLLGPGNSYDGTTTVLEGTLQISASSGDAITGPLIIGNETGAANSAKVQSFTTSNNILATVPVLINASGQLDVSTLAESVASVSGTGRINIGTGGTLTVGGDNSSATFDGSLKGPGTLIKAGTGTLLLTGNSAIGGGSNIKINVNAGTLRVDGELPFDSPTLVAASATLAGTGKVGDVKTLASSAIISPGGDSVGALSLGVFSDVDLSSGGTLLMQINDASGLDSDQFAGGNLAATGGTLNFSVTPPLTRNVYILSTRGASGSFSQVLNQPAGYDLLFNYQDGSFAPHLALVKPGIVTTTAATDVTSSSARLNGTINVGGQPATGYFQFGLFQNYGARTPGFNVTGSSAKPVSAVITGLNGGTTYHFQLVAGNNGGPVHGQDFSFTTLGAEVQTFSAADVLATSATLEGGVNPRGSTATSFFEFGLTPALGSKKTIPGTLTGNGGLGVAASLTGLLPNRVYHYRMAASTPDGISRGTILTFQTARVLPPALSPGTLPFSIIRYVGGTATFSINAFDPSPGPTGVPLLLQWFRNGKALPGATSANLILPNLTFAHAGTYTCQVKNIVGSITSPPVELGVVDTPLPKLVKAAIGSTVTLTAVAAGNGLGFSWTEVIDGINGFLAVPPVKTLVLKKVQPTDSGVYRCSVNNDSFSGLQIGDITLQVFDAKPIVLAPVLPPEGIVGGDYSFQIPIDTASSVAPTSFTVKGLPGGLTVDGNGRIAGRIAAVQTGDKTYSLTIKATNSKGSSPEVPASLLVHEFPPALTGRWEGLVAPDALPLAPAHLNSGLGGALSLNISSIGGYTGRFTLSGTSFPVTGVFRTVLDDPAFLLAGAQRFVSTVEIKRTGKSTLRLELIMDVNSPAMDGQVTDLNALTNVAVIAIRHGWSASTPFPDSGPYTMRMLPGNGGQVGNLAFPQGRGFASITISALGVATIAARVADGVVPVPSTSTSVLSANKGFFVHQQLGANTASLHGNLNVLLDFVTPVNGNKPLLEGFLSWMKNAQPAASKDRAYRSGFTDTMGLQVAGGFYTPPAAGSPVLGLAANQTPGQNNARLVFTNGGLTSPESTLVNRQIRISPENLADLSNPAANPTSLNLKITPATGAISGSFILTDGTIKRTAPFFGVLVPRTDVREGSGFFLLPGLAPSATTSPILSGEALLLPP